MSEKYFTRKVFFVLASGQLSIDMIVGTTTSDSIVDTLERWWHVLF